MDEKVNLDSGLIIKGDFLTADILDTKFKNIAKYHLDRIHNNNPKSDLNRINYDKLCILVESIENYRPKSKSRTDKKSLVEYLKNFENPIADYNSQELLELRLNQIESVVLSDKYGFVPKFIWFAGLFFSLPIDLIILAIVNLILWIFKIEFNLYVPFFTIFYIINQIRTEIKAKKEGKLW